MALRPPHRLSEVTARRVFLTDPPTGLDPHFQSGAVPTLLRLPFANNVTRAVQEC